MRTDRIPMDAVLNELAVNKSTSDPSINSNSRRKVTKYPEKRWPQPDGSTDLITSRNTHTEHTLLSDTLLRRYSTLNHSTSAVSTKGILQLATESLDALEMSWPIDFLGGDLETLVISFHSTDLEPGFYKINKSEISFLSSLSDFGPIENLGIQREFTSGAGMVVVYAQLAKMESELGVHGYRSAAVRASMMAYDFHLRCLRDDLVGSVFGGFIPSSVRHLVRSDGITRHPMIGVTFGRPNKLDTNWVQ